MNQKQYHKIWREKNKKKCQDYRRRGRWTFRFMMNLFKSTEPCMDCNKILPPECMDFDHVRGTKLFSLNNAHAGGNIADTQKEIEKCELVCSNCHRIRSKERGNWCNETLQN